MAALLAPETMPVLLLKTKSSPGDAYEELFSSPAAEDSFSFEPRFLPVLEHRFEAQGLNRVQDLLKARQIGAQPNCAYGGLIFTSQRAVEAFAKVVEEERGAGDQTWPHLQDVPVYSVGPATTRCLKAISQVPPLNIVGEHTGNGDSLARFILEHYSHWYSTRPEKPALLFLVGEQRRDIIPKTLMNESLASEARIPVDELVVYGTGVMESFKHDFDQVLRETTPQDTRWVVVFSPTGCDAMLRGLGLLDETTGKAKRAPDDSERRTWVATIGPTTRDYLKTTFDFEPDVCAETPSPQGIRAGIVEFLKNRSP